MSTKLTHKTVKIYIAITISIFIITIPAYYFIMQKLWIQDIDESLAYQKEYLVNGIEKYDLTTSQIKNYSDFSSKVDNNISINELSQSVHERDSIYYTSVYDSVRKHAEPYRVLESYSIINNKPYHIIIIRDLVENEDLFFSILGTQTVILSIFIILVLFISIYYFKRALEPLFLLTDKLKTIKLDRPTDINVDCKGIYEFENLKKSIDTLINHNYQLFLSQKEFIENASHEIQTPLAVIKSQIDLMVDLPSIDASQMERIINIDKQIRYLSAINKNLLLLAKIDNNQFLLNENVDVSEVLSGYYDHIEEELQLINKKIVINSESVILKNSNTILFMSLCSNLINNAIKYSTSCSTIYINLKQNEMTITNSGKSQKLQENHIFERFFKESDKSSGAGIGLSIVLQICKVLNYQIKYEFEEPNNHSFIILFNS